jgi:hypothetical protein
LRFPAVGRAALLCSVNDAGNVLPSTCVYLNGRLSGSGTAELGPFSGRIAFRAPSAGAGWLIFRSESAGAVPLS